MKLSCMCSWMLVVLFFLPCMRKTVVRSVILAQASSSRLGESSRVLTATRTRLGDQSTFWATPCLAQARRSRLSENSWKSHVAHLAWARIRCVREASVSPERVCEWVLCFLGCLDDLLHVWFGSFFLNMMYVNMLGCLGFMNEIGMLGMGLIMGLWFRDVLTWEWYVWDQSGGYGMRGMKFNVIGVIPWVPWGDFMVACSVYIKIRIQVRIASRNSKGSVSLK